MEYHGYGTHVPMTAASFAAAAAAASSNNSPSLLPGMYMVPGTSSSTASPHQHSTEQLHQPQKSPNVTWTETFKSRKEYTVVKKVIQLLQDNRLKTGDDEEKLRELNRSQTESFPILKTILNAIFITTGVVLLIAVVVVIIYTSLVKSETDGRQWSADVDRHEEPSKNHHPIIIPQPSNKTISKGHMAHIKTEKRCRFIPIVQDGEIVIKFGELCFQVPVKNETEKIRMSDAIIIEKSVIMKKIAYDNATMIQIKRK